MSFLFVKMFMVYVKNQNRINSDFTKVSSGHVLDGLTCSRTMQLTVVHDKIKSGITCLGRNQEYLLSKYHYLMNGTEQEIRS